MALSNFVVNLGWSKFVAVLDLFFSHLQLKQAPLQICDDLFLVADVLLKRLCLLIFVLNPPFSFLYLWDQVFIFQLFFLYFLDQVIQLVFCTFNLIGQFSDDGLIPLNLLQIFFLNFGIFVLHFLGFPFCLSNLVSNIIKFRLQCFIQGILSP